MAASFDAMNEKSKALKQVLTGKVEDAQAKVRASVEDVQTRLKAMGDAPKQKLEELKATGLEQINGLKGQLNLDKVLARFKGQAADTAAVEDVASATIADLEPLKKALEGLASKITGSVDGEDSELAAVKAAVEGLAKKLENLRRRVTESVKKQDFKKLLDRVSDLEAAAKGE